MNYESLIVAAIVLGAAVYLASLLRKKKGPGCCGTSPAQNLIKRPEEKARE